LTSSQTKADLAHFCGIFSDNLRKLQPYIQLFTSF
jgi:hypothetical protein